MAGFDAKKVSPVDWGVIGGGGLVLIAMFLPWYGVQSTVAGFSAKSSVSAWSAGFSAWFGCLLVIAAGVVVLLRVLGQKLPDLPVGAALLALGLAALGTLFILLRVLTFDTGSVLGLEYGRKIGAWIGLLAAIIAAVTAFLSFQASGEPLAFDSSRMPNRAGGAGTTPPAAPGYAPPPPAGYAPPPADVPPPSSPGFAPPPPPPAPPADPAPPAPPAP